MATEPIKLPPADQLRPPRPPDAVQSLERGLAIILAFDSAVSLNLTQIIEKTGFSRSATRRLLMTLVDLGYINSSGREYRLAPGVLWLGYTIYQGVTMSDICKPHLQLLARTLGTSASVAVLEGDSVRYLCRVMDASRFAPTITEGTRLPAHQTSLGRVLLSTLPEAEFEAYLQSADLGDSTWLRHFRQEIANTRSQGWSATNQIMEIGIQAIAVPLRNRNGDIIAAVSTATSETSGSMQEFICRSLPALIETEIAISLDLRPDFQKA